MRSGIHGYYGHQGLRGAAHKSPKARANLRRGEMYVLDECSAPPWPPPNAMTSSSRKDMGDLKWEKDHQSGVQRTPRVTRVYMGPHLATLQIGENLAKEMILIHRNANTSSRVEVQSIVVLWILTSSASRIPKFLGFSSAAAVMS